MASWLIIMGSGLDDWIYWHLLVHSLVITINYNNSQSICSRTLLPGLRTTRSILVLRLNHDDWLNLGLSYITTDGQSVSLAWYQVPIWGLWPDFYYCQTIAGFLIWGALSDERTSLSFTMYNIQYILLSQIWDSPNLVCLSYITTDGQSASLSWNKPPILGFRPDFFINFRQLRACWCRAPSLTSGRVCLLLCTVYNIFAFCISCVIHSLT
jgi:hypothetical protein